MPEEYDVRKLLATNLKRARLNRGLSQLALANELGMAHNFINDIEHEKKWVSPDTIERLCRVLNISPHHLLLPEGEPVVDKDAAVAKVCDEILEKATLAISEVRTKYLG